MRACSPCSTDETCPQIFLPRGMVVPLGATRSSASLALKCWPCLALLVSSLSLRRIRKVCPSGIALGAGGGAVPRPSAARGKPASSITATHKHAREPSLVIPSPQSEGITCPRLDVREEEIGCLRITYPYQVDRRSEERRVGKECR